VAIVGPAQKLALSEAIRQSAQFQVKSIPAPANLEPSVALSRGDLDVIVRLAKTPGTTEMAKTPETIEIVTNGGSDRAVLATKRIMAMANDVRDRNLAETLKADSKPANFLKIFTIKMRNLAAIAEMSTYILPAICAFALFMIGFGALYPAVCAFPEEREKHTLDSTLMLPVGRSSVVIGKTLAITLAGFLSGYSRFSLMCRNCLVVWVVAPFLATSAGHR
jgi:ABC-type Na+ efflux pump permease subunit